VHYIFIAPNFSNTNLFVMPQLIGVRNPMQTLMHMSTPITRSKAYQRPPNPTKEQKARIQDERSYPHVEFGVLCFTNQNPNTTGGKTGRLHSGEDALHMWVPTNAAKRRFDGMRQGLANTGIVMYSYTEFDDFHKGVFNCTPYEEGGRGSKRIRKIVGVNVPKELKGMVKPEATKEAKESQRAAKRRRSGK
jgi:hypothetical protein